ncbi:MAG: helix-turn-helix transcriptional regulator [Bacillota bacterium]|nr:helix-turn-helix transcriptional regulator [Bacillota bacterium]
MACNDRLKYLRGNLDLTQADIAKLLNISKQKYIKYEIGECIPKIKDLIILANFYKTSLDYILDITDVAEPYPPIK